jgi:hypothetical protein
MKNLQLSLKTKWFEMTKLGIKTEDYRKITPYWMKRLCEFYGHNVDYIDYDIQGICDLLSSQKEDVVWLFKHDKIRFKDFSTNIMTLGYPKSGDTERILKYKHKGIEIRTGNTEWGAEPNKLYFVIKHGGSVE